MEDRSWLDLDIVNGTGPAFNISEFGVVSPRRHIGNAQALVSVDVPIRVVLTLVWTPVRRARGRQIKFRDRVPRQIPELCRAVLRRCRIRCEGERHDGNDDME